MIRLIDEPDRRAIATPLARLEFLLSGDRWSHRLLIDGGPGVVVLSSVEALASAPADRPPPSPAYQEVNLQAGPGHAMALALGRFGPHHYAATFTVRHLPDAPALPEGHQGPPSPTTTITVDVADRSPGGGVAPAATYTVHVPPSAIGWATTAGACWAIDPGRLWAVLELEPGPQPGDRLLVDEAGRAACRAQVLAGVPPGRTARLRYCWLISADQPR
jgi:hypothetical protein